MAELENLRTVTFTLTRADLRSFSRYIAFKQNPRAAAARLIIAILLLIWGIVFAHDTMVRPTQGGGRVSLLTAIALSPALWIGALLLLVMLLQAFVVQVPKVPYRAITIRDFGMVNDQSEWQTVLGWNSFIRWVYAKEAIYAFVSPVMAIPIPLRAFRDETEMKGWFEQANRYMDNSAEAPPIPTLPASSHAVRFVSTVRDFERAYLWAARNTPLRNRLGFYAFPAIFVSLMAIIDSLFFQDPRLFGAGVIMVLSQLLVLSWIVRRMRSFVAKQVAAIPGNLTPRAMALTSAGVLTKSETSGAVYPWSSITKISSDRDLLYFLLTSDTPIFVPRSAFLDQSDADSFLAAARAFKAGDAPAAAASEVWPPPPSA